MSGTRLSLFLLGTLLALSTTAYVRPAHSDFTQNQKFSDLEIAARFAPVFYQALGDKPRSDYITNFDFDGDWRGDNNWENVDDRDFQLKAFVYYAVAETSSHFFIHYAVFHPRDYKGGERKGAILSDLIREGAKRGGQFDPTGLANEVALAHENDMEGCLIVVKKSSSEISDWRVAFVETLHHNNFSRYLAGEPAKGFASVRIEDGRPLLYVEPKGHGIEAFTGDPKQTARKEFLRYVYNGQAEVQSDETPRCRDLETSPCNEQVSYALLPMETTLWLKAKGQTNETYAELCEYGSVSLSLNLKGNHVSQKSFKIGKVGCAFLGKVGGHNMARAPWGWFDKDERDRPLGLWFFNPATTVKRDFQLDGSFSIAYVQLPFWAK